MNFKKRIFVICTIFAMILLYLIVSYKGLFIFEPNFNDLDYLIFNITGDAILVGIITYFSTKSISLEISRKEFKRNNKLDVNVLEKNHSLFDFNIFLNTYGTSNNYFGLSSEDQKIIEYVYKKYHVFSAILNKEYLNNLTLENVLNFPFISSYIVKGNFIDNWKEMLKECAVGKNKRKIELLKSLISEEDFKYFERFSKIIGKIKYFEITNLNSLQSCTLLITADDMVINKISCLSNMIYGLYVYFDEEKWINFIGFNYDYDGNEQATKLVSFKYNNGLHDSKPSDITLEKHKKINK